MAIVGNDLTYAKYTKEMADAIKDDTKEIGVAGAGLTGLGGMSVGMKAEVNAECDTALTDYDAPTKAEMDTAFGVTDGKIDVVDGIVDDILLDTAEIGAAGAGLTDLGGMSDTMKAQVNAECDTALTDYAAAKKTELDTAETNIIAAITGLSGIRKTVFSAPAGSEGAVIYEAGTWKDVHVVAEADKDTYIKGLVITNSGTPTDAKYRITIDGSHAYPYYPLGNPILSGVLDQFDMPVIVEAGMAWKVQVNCGTADGNATLDEIDIIKLG